MTFGTQIVTVLSTVRYALLSLLTLAICAQEKLPDTWPSIRKGHWRTETDQIFPNPEHRTQETVECKDLQFSWGYQGKTPIQIGGCKFSSRKVRDSDYIVTITCELQGLGQGISEHQVMVSRGSEFVDVVETKERFKSRPKFEVVSKRITKGTWLRDCGKDE